MHDRFLTADSMNIVSNESQSRGFIAPILDRAGMTLAEWPLSVDDAARLLHDGADFEVDGDELRRLAGLGQVPAVEAWDARDVLAAVAALNLRRQWQLCSPLHTPAMSAPMRNLGECLEAGEVGRVHLDRSLAGMDARLALVLLTESDERGQRVISKMTDGKVQNANMQEMRERLFASVLYLLYRDFGIVL
jgi:hypothetical protein